MSEGTSVECAICGRVLPNRYAVAGRCEQPGCGKAFCALHWHNGNRRCRDHGWRPGGMLAPQDETAEKAKETIRDSEDSKMNEGTEGQALCAQADSALPPEKKASILKQIGSFAVALGKGAGALAKKLSGIKSTDEALREIEAQIADNRARREPVARRYDELYKLIVGKKKLYQAAPPARKKILEMELKSAIAEYQSLERQMTAYLNNETILTKVKGRMCELVAVSLRSVSEAQIDKLTDDIEDAADETENIDGAIGELDKAGVRREREDGSFEDALSAFGDELPDISEPQAEEPSPAVGEAPKPADPLADF